MARSTRHIGTLSCADGYGRFHFELPVASFETRKTLLNSLKLDTPPGVSKGFEEFEEFQGVHFAFRTSRPEV